MKFKVGDVLQSNLCGSYEILERFSGKIKIRFLESGYVSVVDRGQVRKGSVKDPFVPVAYDRAFIGDGAFTKNLDPKLRTKASEAWHSMFKRCYEPRVHLKHQTYFSCNVHQDWWNFQSFAKFYCENRYRLPGWELDKDLLIKGNKLYSDETCVFLPRDINGYLKTNNSRRGDYLLGVDFNEEKQKYFARCRDDSGTQRILKYCNTQEEAFFVYKQFKEDVISQKARIWKEFIDPKAYNALINYEVNPYD